MKIEGGENYLWRGDDWSFASRAGFIFGPSVGLVHLDYLPPDNDLFPEQYRDQFYIALAGTPGAPGPGKRRTQRRNARIRFRREPRSHAA